MPSLYLKRYAYAKELTQDKPSPHLRMSIVIPCYNEPALLDTLQSLYHCTSANSAVEVLVIINEQEGCDEEISQCNQKAFKEAKEWAEKYNSEKLKFLPFYLDNLPRKHAGVGLARKIGMDEAVRRFSRIKVPHNEALIVCLDADSLCLPNYLQAIEAHFQEFPDSPGCALYYEHPLEGELSPLVYEGIVKYELFLRYYVHALRYAGFPHAFQTIGSSMAVRLSAYVKQGGMNRRKAGEDFYFLHKIIPLGNFSELTSTTVIPSPRVSDRVPFGTGKAMGVWVSRGHEFYPAYHPHTFVALKELITNLKTLFNLPATELGGWLSAREPIVLDFLQAQNFDKEILKIRAQSVSPNAFEKKIFEWLNAFRILKYVHFSREHYYRDIAVEEAATWLLKKHYGIKLLNPSDRALLNHFRKIDQKRANHQ